jgi:hypothetical protein
LKIIQHPIEYEAEVNYPSRYYTAGQDEAIQKLADKHKGELAAAGMAMGRASASGRDLAFVFKTKAARAKFVKALGKAKELHVAKVYLS